MTSGEKQALTAHRLKVIGFIAIFAPSKLRRIDARISAMLQTIPVDKAAAKNVFILNEPIYENYEPPFT